MSLSGAKFPEVWEFGGSKKPGVSKKQKIEKTKNNISKLFSAEAPSAKTSGKLFFCFFGFFGFLETPGFLEPPNNT